MCETGEHVEGNSDKNADASFTSVTSEAPDDPSPRDARRALKTLQPYAANNLFGVAAMNALMKLKICMTDAKLDKIHGVDCTLPE